MCEQAPWIDWEGGECPVPPDTLVDIRIRNARRQEDLLRQKAGSFYWQHGNMAWIIAYRRSAA